MASKNSKTKKGLREPVNGLTHVAGGSLASVGLIMLLVTAVHAGRSDQIMAFNIFGFSLIAALYAAYAASALYHLLRLSPTGVARLRRIPFPTSVTLKPGSALDSLQRLGHFLASVGFDYTLETLFAWGPF